MSAECRCISVDDTKQFGLPDNLRLHANESEALFGGYVNGEPFCIIGVIPYAPAALEPGAGANIWGWNTSLVAEHPYVYARWSRRLMELLLTRYPRITGYCTVNKHKWVQFFGGKIIASDGIMSYFEVSHANVH